MKKISKVCMLIVMVLMMAGMPETVQAKTSKVTINMNKKKYTVKRPAALKKAKKVSVKSSKRTVATVKYYKKGRKVKITGKRAGKATITVKCKLKRGKKKTYRYVVKVKKAKKKATKEVTSLKKSKEAFRIQNKWRKEKGVQELQWSEELYQFCLYRMKTSGFDDHKNLGRDANDYFGKYFRFKRFLFGENMTMETYSPREAMSRWKKSSGHYENLLESSHRCGAIAMYKGMWIAIFLKNDVSEVDNWREHKIKKVTVKRYDTASNQYLDNFSIGYYEPSDKWNTLTSIKSTEGERNIYLEVGKTYIIYEKRSPDGCEKAERVQVTISDDLDEVIVLKS